jgi:hypothetical protein
MPDLPAARVFARAWGWGQTEAAALDVLGYPFAWVTAETELTRLLRGIVSTHT